MWISKLSHSSSIFSLSSHQELNNVHGAGLSHGLSLALWAGTQSSPQLYNKSQWCPLMCSYARATPPLTVSLSVWAARPSSSALVQYMFILLCTICAGSYCVFPWKTTLHGDTKFVVTLTVHMTIRLSQCIALPRLNSGFLRRIFTF